MLLVQKYGGTSVADVGRIREVARRCLTARARGHDLVVVVSALAGETNRLLELVRRVAPAPNEREQDVVVATGEQLSAGLLALAIQE
jgi:aspartate kinase